VKDLDGKVKAFDVPAEDDDESADALQDEKSKGSAKS
jgi:hypothetical protein